MQRVTRPALDRAAQPSSSSPASVTSAAPSLADVVKALGPSVAHLVGTDAARRTVSTLVLHDPLSDLRTVTAGFLLALGVRPEGDAWHDLLKTAADRGYVGVGVKASGVPRHVLLGGAADSSVSVVALADEIPWEQLVTLASSAMRHSYSTEPALANTRLGDLFALANAVAATVCGATAIVDARQSIIAYSTVEGQPIDDTRRNSILGLRVPSRPATDTEYQAVHGATGVVEMPASNADYPRLAVPIRADGELLGSVWVIDERGAASEATKIELQHAADIAALHLLQARAEAEVSDRRRGDMLCAVMDDPAAADEAAAALGISPTRTVRIAAISIAQPAAELEPVIAYHHMLELVVLHCTAELGFSAAVVRSHQLYVLLPVASDECDGTAIRRLLDGIAARARRSYGYQLVIGLGAAVVGLAETGRSRAQATQVVQLMRRELAAEGVPESGVMIGFAESFTARLALLGLAEHVAVVDDAAGDTLATMRDYDLANAADYVPTLKAFFSAHGNISVMAQALHVHVNTCRYRMSRIAELFHIDLDDRDERLVLWLQLRLHELID
jgi:sugar diacid utilization regulator